MTDTQKSQHVPQVSLILLTMNRKDMLENCLRSVQRQTFSDMEIIVVDNASSDGTADIVQSLFPGVRYFYLGTNLGVAGGRNYGIRMARGELCVFIDDDAVFADNGALNRAVSYFRSNDELGLLSFRVLQPHNGVEEYKGIPRADKKIINEDYECSYFCGAGFACRRCILDDIKFWDFLFYCGEELDFSYRLLDKGYRIIHSYSVSVLHYETPQSRVSGNWIYFGTRNRCLVAARNLPWTNVFSHLFLWWAYYFISSIRNRHPLFFLNGAKDALISFPKALKSRHCISKETMKKLQKLSGRIYY